MITFEPDAPWEVGQYVTFREGDAVTVHVVESVEEAPEVDGVTEKQYHFVPQRVWEHRRAGVRPYIELE